MPSSKNQIKGALVDSWGRTNNRKLPDKNCAECGRLFKPIRSKSSYCSVPCARKKNGGANKKQETWWKNSKGYIEGKVWVTETIQIRVKKHRFVMEGIIGRPLNPWEDVHHIDGIKDNNSPENLQIISHGDHSRISNANRDYKKGYKMNLTPEARKARSLRAIAMRLGDLGRDAIAKAEERIA
jgi:hypothetical protein